MVNFKGNYHSQRFQVGVQLFSGGGGGGGDLCWNREETGITI